MGSDVGNSFCLRASVCVALSIFFYICVLLRVLHLAIRREREMCIGEVCVCVCVCVWSFVCICARVSLQRSVCAFLCVQIHVS